MNTKRRPVRDPPAGDPPVGDPPVGDPPAGDPPVGDPPVGDPPVGGPPVEELRELLEGELIVPIRSSTGQQLDASRVPTEGFRHGSDARGPFLAAFTSREVYDRLGPSGSDSVTLAPRDLFERARAGQERLVIDPGDPNQREIGPDALASLFASLDAEPEDAGPEPEPRAARPRAATLAALTEPDEIPQPFADALRTALEELPQVQRAWVLRTRGAWTAGIQLSPDSVLAHFDEVRNRLHAIATEHLGSRRSLAVTDLRAPVLREQYDAVAAPFYERRERKGLISRLFGR